MNTTNLMVHQYIHSFIHSVTPQAYWKIGLWVFFLPKFLYSLLLFRMATQRLFCVPLDDEHPNWFLILLPQDLAQHIIREYLFPEVSLYSLCLYLYSYFLFIRFWRKYALLNVMRMSPFGLSATPGKRVMTILITWDRAFVSYSHTQSEVTCVRELRHCTIWCEINTHFPIKTLASLQSA